MDEQVVDQVDDQVEYSKWTTKWIIQSKERPRGAIQVKYNLVVDQVDD